MHRNYYGERPDHYDNGYHRENTYFPHHHHRDQYSVNPRWNGNYQGPRPQHDRDHDHSFNESNNRPKYGNNRQHNDGDDGRHNSSYHRDNHD
ncbi:MAG TPA: hypothetical protein VIF86_02175 [Methylobacter sp.]